VSFNGGACQFMVEPLGLQVNSCTNKNIFNLVWSVRLIVKLDGFPKNRTNCHVAFEL
jgi:hypothetical protein